MVKYTIDSLGDPSVPLVSGSVAHGLNNFGMVVGEARIPGARAVFWNPSPTFISFGNLWGTAYGVNDVGDIVGSHQEGASGPAAFFNKAFLFQGGKFQDLASVFPGETSVATDINNTGVIAAWVGEPGLEHAFTFDANSGTVTALGVLPGHTISHASAINNAGHVVGMSARPGEFSHAFLFDGTLKDLGTAKGANGINDSGQVVGSLFVNGGFDWRAYRCDTSGGNPQFVDLGVLPGFFGSEALAVNNNGDIVGESYGGTEGDPDYHAFIFPAGRKMLDLNELIPSNSGWKLHWASAINDNGQIAGTGTHNGRFQAYLLTPIPFGFPPSRPSYQRDETEIDPMRIILGGWYWIWVEAHHPHVPILSSIEVVLRKMPVAERRAALERAKRLGDFCKRIESLIEQMMDVR